VDYLPARTGHRCFIRLVKAVPELDDLIPVLLPMKRLTASTDSAGRAWETGAGVVVTVLSTAPHIFSSVRNLSGLYVKTLSPVMPNLIARRRAVDIASPAATDRQRQTQTGNSGCEAAMTPRVGARCILGTSSTTRRSCARCDRSSLLRGAHSRRSGCLRAERHRRCDRAEGLFCGAMPARAGMDSTCWHAPACPCTPRPSGGRADRHP